MTTKKLFFFFVLFCTGCGYSNDFFEELLDLNRVELIKICSDEDISFLGDGKGIRQYKLEDSTYQDFLRKFPYGTNEIDAPKPGQFSKKFDFILKWKKTPIDSNDYRLLKVSHHFGKSNNCFGTARIRELITGTGNFWAAYTIDPPNTNLEYFKIFFIEGETKFLYILQSTW